MKRFLLSLLTIGTVGALAFGLSSAFFSDMETSSGNIFQHEKLIFLAVVNIFSQFSS